jgi:hypothetical protein
MVLLRKRSEGLVRIRDILTGKPLAIAASGGPQEKTVGSI